MMDEIASLRAQLSAAEFLCHTLRDKLIKAEEQYAAAQQYHNHRIPANPYVQHANAAHAPGTALEPSIRGGVDGAAQYGSGNDDVASGASINQPTGHETGEQIDENLVPAEDGGDEVVPAEYPVPTGTELPVLSVKTVYPSLGAVKDAVTVHALAQGWTVTTKKRDRIRIVMGCRQRVDCIYHLRAESCAGGARISSYKPAHTCHGADDSHVTRHPVSHLSFLRQEVPKLLVLDKGTTTEAIQEAVFQRFGTRISKAQCAKLKGPSRQKRFAVQACGHCGVVGHNKLTCAALKDMTQSAG
jgi:hypothetical protein